MKKNLKRKTLNVKVQEPSIRISSTLRESSKFGRKKKKNKRVTAII
jgi:hypothetical protein